MTIGETMKDALPTLDGRPDPRSMLKPQILRGLEPKNHTRR